MAGRENSEDFEREWQQAFEGFEQEPPTGVWGQIDSQLTYQQMKAYRAKAAMYRWVAAAVILLAVGVTAWQYHYLSSKEVIRYSAAVNADAPDQEEQTFSWNIPLWFADEEKKTTNFVKQNLVAGSTGDREMYLQSGVYGNIEGSTSVREELSLERLGVAGALAVPTNLTPDHLRILPVYNFEKQKLKADPSRYWAGLNVGSAGFKPNYQSFDNQLVSGNNRSQAAFSLASNDAVDTNSPPVREDMSAGETVSFGVNFGVKLSDRWVLESGLQYARAEATTVTNIAIQTSAYQEVIPATSQVQSVEKVNSTLRRDKVVEYEYRDIDLNNQFEFAAVPVKAGYRLLDDRLSLELNAGVIANVYLGNKLSGSDDVASITIGPGNESPYRDLSFSGLAGVEMGYQLFRNFDVVVEPNYRRALSPLTKQNSGFRANPAGFGLMTGIRYNFN
ncbi:hypothetical protein [Marinoscillum furvescens]|uniref:Outer membrane protein with beta-barrel domain n=1 Tax=Marinoscillum furvescens DSM 4134 TaxID=1122208 RepID=A0A3D9L699_MARFU|nr:hypothetical protein [Marinoscillum furvescens]REE01226.1 hypothetical protein C7460_104246 [Marinoscillum furvescens DSM 4134]